VPVLNNVRYASDGDHSRYESELTLWAIADIAAPEPHERRHRRESLPSAEKDAYDHRREGEHDQKAAEYDS
jgi:hypothetical protein